MDRLTQYISRTIGIFEENLKSGEPNVEQLSSFLQNVGKEVNRLTSAAPKRVQAICLTGFSLFRWDLKQNRFTKSAAGSAVLTLSGLKDLLGALQTWSPPVIPSEEELADISKACEKLWDLDSHRLQPSHDYEINVQGGKAVYDQSDRAALPLFTSLDESIFQRPTVSAFIALLDNYSADEGVTEKVTNEEMIEESKFINLLCDTACMQYVHGYLSAKQLAPADREGFVALLRQSWFGLYRRMTDDDTCGFEHVFIGEIDRDGNVSGLHNWIQLYLEEKKGALDYLGYIKPKRSVSLGANGGAPRDHQQLITMQFAWNGAIKKCSSSFIGTSPEFEMALFTLAFFCGQEKTVVQCGPYKVEISAFKMRNKGKVFIGSSFPSEAPLDQHEAATKIQTVQRGNSGRGKANQVRSKR